jgi:hypothetical protein
MKLKLIKESPLRRLDGITVHKNGVAIAKTGEGHGMPWVTAIIKVDPDSFGQLAQAMMNANANEAIKAFGMAMANGIEHPENSN